VWLTVTKTSDTEHNYQFRQQSTSEVSGGGGGEGFFDVVYLISKIGRTGQNVHDTPLCWAVELYVYVLTCSVKKKLWLKDV
jgi:hypothetical protein